MAERAAAPDAPTAHARTRVATDLGRPRAAEQRERERAADAVLVDVVVVVRHCGTAIAIDIVAIARRAVEPHERHDELQEEEPRLARERAVGEVRRDRAHPPRRGRRRARLDEPREPTDVTRRRSDGSEPLWATG